MKYWMLVAICSGLCGSLSVHAGVVSGANEDASVVAEQVFMDGVAFCNQASKLSRTDAPAARTHLAQYLHHLERATQLAPEMVKNNGFIQREAKRCTLVEDNIARLEAMTLAETSLQRCGDARVALDTGALSQAQNKFDEYQAISHQAVAITPTVMRVGSLGVQFRRCDQLVEKIALAKLKRARVAKETEHAMNSFAKVLEGCAQGEKSLQSQVPTEDKLRLSQRILRQVQEQLRQADQQAAELVKSAVASGAPYSQQVTDIQGEATTCQQQLAAQLDQLNWRIEQQEPATALLQNEAMDPTSELPSPYAARPADDTEMKVQGGVVQLGSPEF